MFGLKNEKRYKVGDCIATTGFILVALFTAIFGKDALPILIVTCSIPCLIYVPVVIIREAGKKKADRVYSLGRIIRLIMIFGFCLVISVMNISDVISIVKGLMWKV